MAIDKDIINREPVELRISDLRRLTGWTMTQIADYLGQEERRLYDFAKKDLADTPHYTMIRRHLALIYKLHNHNGEK